MALFRGGGRTVDDAKGRPEEMRDSRECGGGSEGHSIISGQISGMNEPGKISESDLRICLLL